MMQLRPYQLEALNNAKAEYANGCTRQLLSLPTGMGKTPTFAALRKHFGFQKRILTLVHTEELAQQAADKLAVWNPDSKVGIEMGSRYADRDCDFVVGSVQTLGREGSNRLSNLAPDEFDAVICDEAHHAVTQSYGRVFEHFGLLGDDAKRLLLGVTATPKRGDGVALGTVFDKLVYQYPLVKAIQDGWLCDLRGLRVRTGTELDDLKTRDGDFIPSELSKAVNTHKRNDLIVREWLQNAQERQTVCFTVDIAHAQALAEAFSNYGVASQAIWGDDPLRKDKLRAHRDGHLRVLTNCGVLTEGYDDWRIGCVVLARPTKSQLLFVQMAGRGTRLPEGIQNLNEARQENVPLAKEDCILLDVTDNTNRHSLVTLSSIFGLPAKLDTKMKKLSVVATEFEQAALTNPSVDFSKLEDINDIETYVQKVNLFEVKFTPEVEQSSKLVWLQTPGGNYILSLPGKEKVIISQDLVDKWHVNGTVRGSEFSDSFNDLHDAFAYADTMVEMFAKDILKLLRRTTKAKWAADPITVDQIRTIKWKLKGKQWPDFTKMTKKDGTLLLMKLFASQ